MSITKALAAALESDMNEEMHELVEEGFGDAITPTESIATAIDAHEEGVQLLESMHEVADAADQTAEAATAISVEALQRNVRHLLKPHKIADMAPAFESYMDPADAQRQLAQETRALAMKLTPAVEALNPSMENRFTYIFLSKAAKIKDASQRLSKLERELVGKTKELEENPIAVNHQLIYQFMTFENDVCKNPVSQIKKDIELIEGLYKAVGDDTRNFLRKLNSELSGAKSNEELLSVYEKLKSTTNPAYDAIKVLGGNVGKSLMGNYRIYAEETSGVKRDDAASWKIGAKVDVTSKGDVAANRSSRWWALAGWIAGGHVGNLAMLAGAPGFTGLAMAIGGAVAVRKLAKGRAVKSLITPKDISDLVSETKKLVSFAEKAIDDYKDMDQIFEETLGHLRRVPNDENGKALAQMVNVAYNAFHSGMQAVYKHTFYLIGGTTTLAEKVVSGAK